MNSRRACSLPRGRRVLSLVGSKQAALAPGRPSSLIPRVKLRGLERSQPVEAQGRGVPAVFRVGVPTESSYLGPHVGRQNVPTGRTIQRGSRGRNLLRMKRKRQETRRMEARQESDQASKFLLWRSVIYSSAGWGRDKLCHRVARYLSWANWLSVSDAI